MKKWMYTSYAFLLECNAGTSPIQTSKMNLLLTSNELIAAPTAQYFGLQLVRQYSNVIFIWQFYVSYFASCKKLVITDNIKDNSKYSVRYKWQENTSTSLLLQTWLCTGSDSRCEMQSSTQLQRVFVMETIHMDPCLKYLQMVS